MSLTLKRNFPLIVMLVALVLVLVLGFGNLPVGAYTVAANPAATPHVSAQSAQPIPISAMVDQVLHNLQTLFISSQ